MAAKLTPKKFSYNPTQVRPIGAPAGTAMPYTVNVGGLELQLGAPTLSDPTAMFDEPTRNGTVGSDLANEVSTNRLSSQVSRQKASAAALSDGPEPETKPPGALMRILDILSRPNYAMAEGAKRGVQAAVEDEKSTLSDIPRGVGAFLSGAKEGITGREKTNFNEMIHETTGKQNKLTALLGFGLDVGLDPLTYLSMGYAPAAKTSITQGVRGVANKSIKEAADGYAAGVVSSLIKDPSNIKMFDTVAINDVNRSLLESIRSGAPPAVARQNLRRSVVKQKAEKDFVASLDGVFESARDEYIRANQRVFQARLGGKNLLPESAGRAVYNAVDTITSPLRKTPVVEAFSSHFSPKSNFGVLHAASRTHEGRGYAAFESNLEKFRSATANLPEQSAKDIAHAMERGYVLDGELGAIQSEVRKLLDDFWESEVSRGLHDGVESYIDNYVPHYYDASENLLKSRSNKVKGINNARMKSEKQRIISHLADAESAGLKPITDIREIVGRRAAEHYSKMSQLDFLEEAVGTYGLSSKGRGAQRMAESLKSKGVDLVPVSFRHLKGEEFLVPKEMKGVLDLVNETIYNTDATKVILRHFDKWQNAIKAGFTVLTPGHHVRNMVGDMFMNFQDGVVNPDVYRHASRIAYARARDFDSVARKELGNSSIKIGNTMFSYDEISKLYDQAGLRSGIMDVDLRRQAGASLSKPLEAARGVASTREDLVRIAHFIDALKKEAPKNIKFKNSPSFEQAVGNAAERVRKFNLDYGDLTRFEKEYMRRVFLFYTFFRKNLPLQLEMMAMRPGRTQTVQDIHSLISNLAGVEESDPKLEDSIPKWIRDMNAWEIGGGRNSVFSTLQLPVSDLSRIPTSPGEAPAKISNELISMLNPLFKGVAELGTGTQAFSGAPIGSGYEYAAGQIPFVPQIMNQFSEKRSPRQKDFDIVNFLTGAGLQEVTEERRRGELRRQQDILQAVISKLKKENKDEFFQEFGQ